MRSRLMFAAPLVVLGWFTPASFAIAAAITETASPSLYTVQAGGTFTLSGFIDFPDTASYQYAVPPEGCCSEFLFGLIPTSPHLGIVAGTVGLSQDFNPPVGGAYFEDGLLGPAGFLGVTTATGPAVTSVTDWREFLVPAGTPPGTYDYSYGILYNETPLLSTEIFFAMNVQVDVIPEPASLILLGTGLAAMVTASRRRYPRSTNE
jgi:hypothetical protein